MDKKAILCELRTEVENMQQAMASILSKIELYQGMLEADEAVQQATVLQLKQQIATLKALGKVESPCKPSQEVKAEVKEEVKAEVVVESESPVKSDAPTLQITESAENCDSPISSEPLTKDARIITDLRKAIGLNDRFRLKHDLFNNNESLLFETIDALNAMSTFAEADAYLKRRFSWSADDATVVYFYEILQRKFV